MKHSSFWIGLSLLYLVSSVKEAHTILAPTEHCFHCSSATFTNSLAELKSRRVYAGAEKMIEKSHNNQSIGYGSVIRYGKNEWALNSRAQRSLCTSIDNFNEIKIPIGAEMYIRGHADSSGNEAYNRIISKKRAMTVKAFVIDGGIPENDITVEWYGSLRPFEGEMLDVWPVSNRRVEITVVQKGNPDKDMYHEEKVH